VSCRNPLVQYSFLWETIQHNSTC